MAAISVIVPVYNVEALLSRCIDSILNQTYSDFELILIDDGSPDNSGKICDNYALCDKRIRVIHKENGGLSSARNAGINIACGKYLCFVDSDDMIHPQMLQILVKSLEDNGADFVSTRFIPFSNDPVDFNSISQVKETVLQPNDFIEELYPDHFEQIGVSAWGKLYKRELFDCIRYPEGKIYEDLHIFLKLLCLCKRVVVIDKPMYFYFLSNESITKSKYLAYDRFDEFSVRLDHANFFYNQGLFEQYEYAINDYLTFFFKNAFAVLLKYQEKKVDFKPYMRQHRNLLFQIICNPKICRIRKICSVLIHIVPSTAAIIARRCIPECLLDEMKNT